MRFPDRSQVLLTIMTVLLLMALRPGAAGAQGLAAGGSSSIDGFGSGTPFASESWSLAGSSSAYLPLGGMGGFVPYSAGPGQGLGVMSRSGQSSMGVAKVPTGMLGSMPSLGQSRGNLTPLAPLGSAGNRMGQSGMSVRLIRRTPSAGTMDPMRRGPVGGYPFRIPPSLLGPGTASPAMSM